jgi:RNA polymerase sigma factor (sigma-70 family)
MACENNGLPTPRPFNSTKKHRHRRIAVLLCAHPNADALFSRHEGESDYDGSMSTSLLDARDGARWFATTHWSVVLAAREGDSPGASEALNDLCRAYWPPLYSYIRREGHDVAEAQDLTQEFFTRLVERDYLARLNHQRGKFRSFLLAFLKHFLSEQREKAQAQKRGGGQRFLSLDAGEGEEGYLAEPADELTPEQIFERRWVQTILQRALDRLTAEYSEMDRAALFEALKDFQPRHPGSLTYAEIGANLSTTEAAIKSAMQRMRQRHREILREEIAHTVGSAQEVEEEIRYMREVLNR